VSSRVIEELLKVEVNMKKVIRIIFLVALLSACSSKPYVVSTTIMQEANKRTEVICTHKTAVVPWYAVVAAGVVSFDYGKECYTRTSLLSEPAFVAEKEPEPAKEPEKIGR
jgi:hypothetical protein